MSILKVSSRLQLNNGTLQGIRDASGRALEETAKSLHDEVVKTQVIPYQTGALQNSTYLDTADSASGKVAIVSNTPYARRLYFHPEYHYSRTENAAAGGQWYKRWLPGGSQKDFARREFIKFYQKEAP